MSVSDSLGEQQIKTLPQSSRVLSLYPDDFLRLGPLVMQGNQQSIQMKDAIFFKRGKSLQHAPALISSNNRINTKTCKILPFQKLKAQTRSFICIFAWTSNSEELTPQSWKKCFSSSGLESFNFPWSSEAPLPMTKTLSTCCESRQLDPGHRRKNQ